MKEPRPSVDTIKRVVSEAYLVQPEDLAGKRRNRAVITPRHVAMWLSWQMTGQSMGQIGRSFGRRDPATVAHAVAKIDALREVDIEMAEAVSYLAALVRGRSRISGVTTVEALQMAELVAEALASEPARFAAKTAPGRLIAALRPVAEALGLRAGALGLDSVMIEGASPCG